MAEDILTKLSR